MYYVCLFVALFLLTSNQSVLYAGTKRVSATRQAVLDKSLYLAVAQGDAAKVLARIKRGANPNGRGDEGQTLLELASRWNKYASSQALLAGGATPNLASDYGGPLAIAAEQGEAAIVHLLLQCGANPDGPQHDAAPLTLALGCAGSREVPSGRLSNISVFVRLDTPANRKLAQQERQKLIQRFKAFDVQQERTLLQRKRAAGLQMVNMLLARGANVNPKTSEGWSPLMAAAGTGNLETVQLLVLCGADVNARNSRGHTVLIQAGSAAVVQYLVEQGAKVNAQDIYGYSPLGSVILWSATPASKDMITAAKFLLTHGADPNLKEKDGTSILKLAKDTGNMELIVLLKDAGAK